MSIEKDEAVNESIDVKPSIHKSIMKLKTLLEPRLERPRNILCPRYHVTAMASAR